MCVLSVPVVFSSLMRMELVRVAVEREQLLTILQVYVSARMVFTLQKTDVKLAKKLCLSAVTVEKQQQ